jgi:hypothetical protein
MRECHDDGAGPKMLHELVHQEALAFCARYPPQRYDCLITRLPKTLAKITRNAFSRITINATMPLVSHF